MKWDYEKKWSQKYIESVCTRRWQPTPVLLPGKSHGRRSLVGCSPWGCWESDMTERLHFHFSLSCIGEGNGNPLQCSSWRIPGTGEPGGLPSMGLHRVGHDWSYLAAAAAVCTLYWKRTGHYLVIDLIMGKKIRWDFVLCFLFGCHETPNNFAFAQDDKRHTQRVGYEQKCPYWHL